MDTMKNKNYSVPNIKLVLNIALKCTMLYLLIGKFLLLNKEMYPLPMVKIVYQFLLLISKILIQKISSLVMKVTKMLRERKITLLNLKKIKQQKIIVYSV